MSKLLLIRHGQASFHDDNYDRLSDLGVRQSSIVGRWFVQTGVTPDAVYTGTLQRQKDSANTALAEMDGAPEPRILPGFDEFEWRDIIRLQLPGLVESDPDAAELVNTMHADPKAFSRVFERVMLRWVSGLHDVDDHESWADFKRRVTGAAREAMRGNQSGKTVCVFTSGGPIAAVTQLALKLTDDMGIRTNWQLRNASITTFHYRGETPMLHAFNAIGHLQAEGDPALITGV